MIKKITKYLILIIILIPITIFIINAIIINTTKSKIISLDNVNNLKDIDCILILGAGIRGNNPSPMLEDRLLQGITLYQNKISKKILVTGDHTKENYDEVNVMKDYLIGHRIPSQDVFMDHAGISTYDSIYRAKHIFKAKKIIIITQQYHLHRALYIAKSLNIEAYGVASNQRTYANQDIREIREVLARTKDFFKSILKTPSKYQGEEISLNGNGDITND